MHARPAELAPSGVNLSSVASDYSPVLALAVSTPVVVSDSGRRVAIGIDSGVVSAPGVREPGNRAAMRQLYVRAILATSPPDQAGAQPPRAWVALAASDSVLLTDSLRIGESRAVGPATLTLVVPTAVRPTSTWLVLEVTGAAITSEERDLTGRVIGPARTVPGGIRVFACPDWNLDGVVDASRRAALRESYTHSC